MDRRNFFKLASAGTAATVLAPNMVFAGTTVEMAGGVYFTKEAPGRWAAKAGGHVPVIEVSRNAGEAMLKVTTPHEMKGYEHYIVKHVVLDGDYKFIAEHAFDPMKDKTPISRFNLGAYQGTVYVLSMCNKHDLWLASATV